MAAQERGYDVNLWASYKQWQSVGSSVKKGERATQIVFFKAIKKTVEQADGTERLESFPLLRSFPVFNIHQVEGAIAERFLTPTAKPIFQSADRADFDRMVAATEADIRYGGSRAVYHRLPADYIQVPHEGHFESFPAYAETLSHELAHWSEHRMEWTGSYALGELRAEMAAIFVTAALGIADSGDLRNHIAYLQSWLEALENDSQFLFRAATAASKSADFILSFSRQIEAQAEPVVVAA
jgi:antirestriction protein ArdC